MSSRTVPMRLKFSVTPMMRTSFWVTRPYLALPEVATMPPTSMQASQALFTASTSWRSMSLRFCISSHWSRLVMMSGNFWTVKLLLPSSSTLSRCSGRGLP